MRRQHLSIAVVLFTALLVAGCASNIKQYRIELPHNLEIISNTESVETTLHIYSLSNQCETDYLGTVDINASGLELGIETGRPSYLEVGFASSSFWGNSSSYIDYGITLLPRKAYRYEVAVSYVDNIYNVIVFEISRATEAKREMQDQELQICGN